MSAKNTVWLMNIEAMPIDASRKQTFITIGILELKNIPAKPTSASASENW